MFAVYLYIPQINIENKMSQAQPQNKIPTAAILVIGNEILSGRTLDKNTQHIALKLGERGIKLIEARVVPDIEAEVIAAANTLRAKADYLFTTGGIGPTHDDITAECIAKAVGAEFGRHALAYQVLENYYGKEDLTEARARMARMPLDATLVDNPVSGAPGFNIENIYVMAGVPKIMHGMLDNILPTLGEGAQVFSETIMCGLPESELSEDLGKIQDAHPDVDIGSYPNFKAGNTGLSVVIRGYDEGLIQTVAQKVNDAIDIRTRKT